MKTCIRTFTRSNPQHLVAALAVGLLVLGPPGMASAAPATRTWDGGGTDDNWTNRFNWVGDIAPVAGDNLVFPPGNARTSINNFGSGTSFGSVLITGTNYNITGNPILLAGGVSSQCPVNTTNTLNLAITLGAAQTFENLNGGAVLIMPGDLSLNGQGLTLGVNAGRIRLGGAISGTGSLSKTGSGTLELYGATANTYRGPFTVAAGTLWLGKTPVVNGAITGILTNAGIIRYSASHQIANTALVVLQYGSLLDLNDYYDNLGPMILTGATLDSGSGAAALYDDMTVVGTNVPSVIQGNLVLSDATRTFTVSYGPALPDLRISASVSSGAADIGLIKNGNGWLELAGTNTYGGTTTLNEGRIWVRGNFGLGDTNAGTLVNSNANLELFNANVGLEPLSLNVRLPAVAIYVTGPCSWSGPVTIGTNVSLFSGGTMIFSNALSGPGSVRLVGNIFEFAGNVTNAYAGDTTVMCALLQLNHASSGSAYSIPHDLIIGGGVADSNVVRLLRCCQMPDGTDVTVLTNGVLDLNGNNEALGGLTFEGGRVDTGGGLLTLNDDVQCLPSDRVAEITGRLSLGTATRTFFVEAGTAYPAAQIYANVSGSGDLTWRGVTFSTVMFRGTNTYEGLTTITNLRVYVYNPWSLGLTNGDTLVQNRGDLWLVNAAITNETVTLADGASLLGNSSSFWTGPVILAGNADLGGANFSTFEISGPISGAGNILIDSFGVVRFAGNRANTYDGTTTLDRGILQLDKGVANGAIPGPLILGRSSPAVTNRLLNHNQIANDAAVTVNEGSLLDLNGFSDTIGPLTLNGARVETGAGTVRLGGDVTVVNADVDSTIRGTVDLFGSVRSFELSSGVLLEARASILGSGMLVKQGPGWMILYSSNAFSGLAVAAQGILDASHPFALGSTTSGTVVSNGATLYLSDNITNETLTLNGPGAPGYGSIHGNVGTNTWAGPIILNADSTVYESGTGRRLDLAGVIQGPGGLTKLGTGIVRLTGAAANTYAGTTRVHEGTLELGKAVYDGAIPGPLRIGDGLGGVGTDVVRLLLAQEIADTAAVTITNTGLLDLADRNDTVGSVSGSGQIDLGNARLTTGGNSNSTLYTGLIVGTGGRLTKGGTGTFTLTGNNTYSGVTTVGEGTLLVGGAQPASPIQVNVFGTLLSTGTVGHLTNYGILAPGASAGSMFSSNTVIVSGAGVLAVELHGPAARQYDRVNARGLVDVSGGKLWLNVGYPPADGDQFVLINNDGAEAVVGTFLGLPNGGILSTNGLQFRVDYNGGDGNDVVLTATNNALRSMATTLSSGDLNGVVDPNECNLVNVTLYNNAAESVTAVSAALVSRTPGVAVTQPFSGYPDVPSRSSRTNATPFQISTEPGFVCGTTIRLDLIVSTATHGTFTVKVALPSGLPGAAHAFSNTANRVIPDGGSVTSTIPVSLTGPIVKVTVGLYLGHLNDADVDAYLVSPDGTTVELTTDNGGAGYNYGSSCQLTNRTIFDDDAAVAIRSGSAPFIGTFRPEGALSIFRGKSGDEINGTWSLVLTDDNANSLSGQLNCWYLTLYDPACASGTGPCEACPDRTIYGSIDGSEPTQSAYMNRTVASVCGVPRGCPGYIASAPLHYDLYTFVNGESNACITVSLTSDCPLFSAAFTNAFNPAILCGNWLADLGRLASNGVTRTYSFNVPAGERFLVTVNEASPGLGCDYVLSVSGGSCRPVLGIRQEGANVVLDWTTAAADYQLQRTNLLANPPHPAWVRVTNEPVVINSRFQVTNNIVTTNRFYQLRKP